ncbi:MAG: DNA replication/repair protein RecF [Dehalococcoidia bacterium]|nr:MAG: DNA replication/repair protein RecF [Dehalococcoidia bacterium]
MIITHLSLTNFRNYVSLDIDLPPHISIFQGDNAQGKSNLLEAITLLATSKSPRAKTEKELINWSTFDNELAACRISAVVERNSGKISLDIALGSRVPSNSTFHSSPQINEDTHQHSPVYKRIKINGIPRRATDLIGQVNIVAFSVHDIDVIGGEPALRRRYLDILGCQIDPQYLHNLQRYQRVLWQRNRLLRQISDKQATEDELSFWDNELVYTGSHITVQRDHLINQIESIARRIHKELSSANDSLMLAYNSSIHREARGDALVEATADIYHASLQSSRQREIVRGTTLVGPHRDELRFISEDVDIGIFGSRGQQRTVALALKLAEASYMWSKTGDYPVLLLDDILSELDSRRREHILESVARYQQVLITTTDLDHFNPGFVEHAALYDVVAGSIGLLTV